MSDLQPIVQLLAAIFSAVYGVLHGQLASLFGLIAPVEALKGMSFSPAKFLADFEALSDTDRAQLEATFDAAVSLPDPTLAAKVAKGAAAINQAVGIAERLFQDYQAILSLIATVKTLFGITAGHLAGLPSAEKPGISIPGVPSWLQTMVKTLLISVVGPALDVAFPAEKPLIDAFIQFISGALSMADFKTQIKEQLKGRRSRFA